MVNIDGMVIRHPIVLLPNINIILFESHLSRKRLISNIRGESRPFFKLGNGHFLFHIAGIISLVCTVIGMPNRIILAFFCCKSVLNQHHGKFCPARLQADCRSMYSTMIRKLRNTFRNFCSDLEDSFEQCRERNHGTKHRIE